MKEDIEETMNKIDWDKPLECEHGNLNSYKICYGGRYVKCTIGATKWIVRVDDGTPQHAWMPRVYNSKRKPKAGELWWCKWQEQIGSEEFKWFQEPIRYDGTSWPILRKRTVSFFDVIEPYGESL